MPGQVAQSKKKKKGGGAKSPNEFFGPTEECVDNSDCIEGIMELCASELQRALLKYLPGY